MTHVGLKQGCSYVKSSFEGKLIRVINELLQKCNDFEIYKI